MNTLDKDVVIKGSITFAQQLLLDGTVEGDIASAGTVTVGESALVKGTIKTGAAVIFGKVEGNVVVQGRCEVKSTATIVGDITAASFQLEEGATFQGRSGAVAAEIAAAPASTPAKG